MIRESIICCLNVGNIWTVRILHDCFFVCLCVQTHWYTVCALQKCSWKSAHPPAASIFFFSLEVAPDTFLSSCDCPNIWVGETFKRDLERSTITLHLCLHWRGRNKSEKKEKKEKESLLRQGPEHLECRKTPKAALIKITHLLPSCDKMTLKNSQP